MAVNGSAYGILKIVKGCCACIHSVLFCVCVLLFLYWFLNNIQIYKCVLTEGQKVLLCQFKISSSTRCTASTNQIVVKQRRMKNQIETVQQIYIDNSVYIYIYIYIYILYIYILYITHIHPTHTQKIKNCIKEKKECYL